MLETLVPHATPALEGLRQVFSKLLICILCVFLGGFVGGSMGGMVAYPLAQWTAHDLAQRGACPDPALAILMIGVFFGMVIGATWGGIRGTRSAL